jgi:hypothetical protein
MNGVWDLHMDDLDFYLLYGNSSIGLIVCELLSTQICGSTNSLSSIEWTNNRC